jgi:TetR/AcrR family tetracycline transcriptional repressor
VKIHQRQVIDVALNLLDEQGLAELQMRAVASRLNVQASALYWHVRNKGELLSLMAWHFYDNALTSVPEGLTWRDWLLTYGTSFRKALLSHRDSAQLCAIARPLDADDTEVAAERLTKPLIAGGLSRHLALSYHSSVVSLALGWCIYEQSESLHDYLARMIGFEESFNTGLKAMVTGFPE